MADRPASGRGLKAADVIMVRDELGAIPSLIGISCRARRYVISRGGVVTEVPRRVRRGYFIHADLSPASRRPLLPPR